MNKLFISCLLLVFIISVQTVNAYDNKNVTMQVYKNELVYCYFGDKDSPVPTCNYIELDDKMRLIDSFLQFLLMGECKN